MCQGLLSLLFLDSSSHSNLCFKVLIVRNDGSCPLLEIEIVRIVPITNTAPVLAIVLQNDLFHQACIVRALIVIHSDEVLVEHASVPHNVLRLLLPSLNDPVNVFSRLGDRSWGLLSA